MHALETIVRINAADAQAALATLAELAKRNAAELSTGAKVESLQNWTGRALPPVRTHVNWQPVEPVAIENNWDSADYTFRNGSQFWEVLTIQPSATEASNHDGSIIVTCEDSRTGDGIQVVATIPLDNRLADIPLVHLWQNREVPQCVKLEVELRHSQCRRNSIGG
jgi:hypothetical protein